MKKLLASFFMAVICFGLLVLPASAANIYHPLDAPYDLAYHVLPDGTLEIDGPVNQVETGKYGNHAESLPYLGENVVIPDKIDGKSVTRIGAYAFSKGTGMVSVVIPEGVYSIGDHAFSDQHQLVSVTLPGTMTSIGDQAFSGCSSLSSISLPTGLSTLGEEAFIGCSSLTSVSIPRGVTEIAWRTFCNCVSLTSVTIPNTVTTIGPSAFQGCTSLTTVSIPDSVRTISSGAFNRSGLTSVTIPGSVTSMDEFPFADNQALTAIYVSPDSRRYKSVDGVLFSKSGSSLIGYPAGRRADVYTIPAGTVEIGNMAFSDCKKLTSVAFPSSLKQIRQYSFAKCTSLTSLVLPDGLTTIDEAAFVGCTHLTSVSIPQRVTEISPSCFKNCTGLNSISIPNSVLWVGRLAFLNCSSLQDVYYSGSKEEWRSIQQRCDLAKWNTPLWNARLHCGAAAFVPENTPSPWAQSGVNAAKSAGIVPVGLQSAYTQHITRGEFCALTTQLYEQVKGKITKYNGVSFSDTSDINVLKMASLGVVSGVGGGSFAPDGTLTREQAAVILAKLAGELGLSLPPSAPSFDDHASISSWAKNAVGQLQKAGIVSGTGGGNFSPNAVYTREQSIITMMKVYEMVK